MSWGLAEFDAERRGYKEGIEAGISQGLQQGSQQKAIETAKNALKMDLPIEQISTLTGLSYEEIKSLSK